jgi:DNA-binding response OmpR family regulator
MRVLLVEDDDLLADGIAAGLALGGTVVDAVRSVSDGRHALGCGSYDAVALDLMLLDGSGLDLLRDMRAAGDRTPVLLLTALDEVADRVRGLDAGADDYLGKPFDLDELAARLRALSRRKAGRATATISWRGLHLDPATLGSTLDGRPVALSRREFIVLKALIERPGVIHSRAELEERLYGWQEGVESNAVEVYIHNLRAKIGRDVIETVRGFGYRAKVAP